MHCAPCIREAGTSRAEGDDWVAADAGKRNGTRERSAILANRWTANRAAVGMGDGSSGMGVFRLNPRVPSNAMIQRGFHESLAVKSSTSSAVNHFFTL
jgi:hypothetical protein